MIINATCTNKDCGLSLSIPIIAGAVLPTLDSYCKKCSSIVVVDVDPKYSEQKIVKNEASKKGEKHRTSSRSGTTQKPKWMDSFENDYLSNTGNNNDEPNQFLSGFINRITPMISLVQMMGKSNAVNEPIHLDDLLADWSVFSQLTKEDLVDRETSLSIGRGQRLSDGFPTSDTAKQGPMKIFLRNVLGCDGRRMVGGTGCLQTTGIVELIDHKTIKLTAKATPIIEMPDLVEVIMGEEPMLISGEVRWIPTELSAQIIDILFSLMPGEKQWVFDILRTMQNDSTEHFGWDSNTYARDIVEDIMNGKQTIQGSRWVHHDGTPLFLHYYERGVRFKADRSRKPKHKVKNPEEFADYRLTNHINSNLGGLLGRLKELGLIYPIKVGRKINFQLTGFGSKILEEYSTEMEEEQ